MPLHSRNQKAAHGLLVVGHGTRSEFGVRQFLELATSLQERLPETNVQPAFLELAEPTIQQAVAALAKAGIQQMVAVPLLLFAAGHVRRDIPAALKPEAPAKESEIVSSLALQALIAEPLGCEAEILELSQRRFQEALAGRPRVASEESCLLLVGRGSSDESATAAMHEFARLRQQMEGGMHTVVAFLAKARPSLVEQLPRIAGRGFRRVIVQPHLLFAGELAESVERQVAAASAEYSQTEWLAATLLADPPGMSGIGTDLLVQVINQRYRDAMAQCRGSTT